MRRSHTLIVVLGFLFFNVLSLQVIAESEVSFKNGIENYENSIKKRDANEEKEEIEYLKKSYKIFNDMIPDTDYRSVIMSYLIYLRFQTLKVEMPFLNQDRVEQYVKDEFDKNFPTLEKIEILSYNETTKSDKGKLLIELFNIAAEKKEKADSLFEKALSEQDNNNKKALLEEALNIWYITEAAELLNKIKKEEKDEFEAGIESKKKYDEAKKYYKKRNLDNALNSVNDSIRFNPTPEAEELRKKIIKRMEKFAFFLDSGNPENFKIGSMKYHWEGNSTNFAKVVDENDIEARTFSKSSSVGAGFIYLFSRSSGIRVSVSSIKQNWKFNTNYFSSWTWLWKDQSESSRNTMSQDASGSLKLISIDYLLHKNIFSDIYLNLYAGPTFYISDLDLFAGIGYAGAWENPNDNKLYPEWFPFKYQNNTGGFGIGGNMGGGLEYKYPPFSIFIEIQYYLLASQKGYWELINQRYEGGRGNFSIDGPLIFPNLPQYEMKINFSTYKISMGARIYL